MRPFGKVLLILFAITYMLALTEFFVYPALAKSDSISGKAPKVMPAGYVNAALQRTNNEDKAKKEDKEGSTGKVAKTEDNAPPVDKGKANAKWFRNANDEREQGNMGKPLMNDPYGFDKASDREKGDRGRPNIEAALSLEEITTMDFNVTDWHLLYLQGELEHWKELAGQDPDNPFYAFRVSFFEGLIENYIATSTSTRIATNREHTIDYVLTFEGEGLEGRRLIVTTALTSLEDYSDSMQAVHFDAGQIVAEESEEVILEAGVTDYVCSYDPPSDLTGWGGFTAELTVTVTDPLTNESYVIKYEDPLLLYRGPAYAP